MFKEDFNEHFEVRVSDAETAATAAQQGYALLEEVGDDLRPSARSKLEAAVTRLEEAMASFEEDPWGPPIIVKVTLTQK